jgi:hypothetical protein
MLLDWWASALDRQALGAPFDGRARFFTRIRDRMEHELELDPGNGPANYWLAAAIRGSGDLDAAWDASIAAWVRAALTPATAGAARADIDRLVTEGLIVDRVRRRPASEQADAETALVRLWEKVKQDWP